MDHAIGDNQHNWMERSCNALNLPRRFQPNMNQVLTEDNALKQPSLRGVRFTGRRCTTEPP
eukprot:670105-Amphidinium_carterae.1